MELVALLCTDIEGSTRLLEESPENYAADLFLHHQILRCAAKESGGEEFLDVGDGLCFAFPNPLNATRAALSIQSQLSLANWTTPQNPLKVRIALHWAAAEFRTGQYRGTAVHFISRLLGAAHAGQILASEAVANELGSIFSEKITPLGTYRLRGFQRDEKLFQIDSRDSSRSFPPLRTRQARQHNLPPLQSKFWGRATELARLHGWLKPMTRASRLVTLRGTGGMGKTRLALEIAHELLNAYDHGVFWVPLSEVTDASGILYEILKALGVETTNSSDPILQIREVLEEAPTLLVLDNFEQFPAEGAAVVSRLLETIPSLYLLITSRSRLGVAGEQELPLPPFPLPATDETRLEELSKMDSVQFFLDCAARARQGEELPITDVETVADICRLLDGIPLAIELAAARLNILTSQELRENFKERTAEDRSLADFGTDPLTNVFNWSLRLLPPEIVDFLHVLSIFRGGWTIPTAAGVSGLSPSLTAGYLHHLLTCSLVNASEKRGTMRFDMLRPIRQWAEEGLGENRVTVYQKHCRFFQNLARSAVVSANAAKKDELRFQVIVESDNLLAALDREPRNQERVFSAVDLSSFVVDGGINRQLQQILMDFRPTGGEILPRTLSRAWHSTGMLQRRVGQYQAALVTFKTAAQLLEELGDAEALFRCKYNLMATAMECGENPETTDLQNELLAYFRERGATQECASILHGLGSSAYRLEKFEEALVFFEQCHDLCILHDHRDELGDALCGYGESLLALGDLKSAFIKLAESTRLRIERERHLRQPNNLCALAIVAQGLGGHETAAFFYGASIKLAQKHQLNLSHQYHRWSKLIESVGKKAIGFDDFTRNAELGSQAQPADWLLQCENFIPQGSKSQS